VPSWKAETEACVNACKITFKEFATACIEAKKAEWSNPKHAEQWINTIDQYANPVIGHLSLDEIDTEHILQILNPIWRTKTETATRVRGRIEWILSSATTRQLRTGLNPAAWRGHLETILPKPTKINSSEQSQSNWHYIDLPEFIG